MSVARLEYGKARALLAKLVLNLTAAATGEVVARAGAAIQAQITSVSRSKLVKHVLSGAALAEAAARRTGTLIQLETPTYLVFHREFWPFYHGIPPFVISRAIAIMEAEFAAAMGHRYSPLLAAEEAAEEAVAVKSRATFKKEIARIYRQSAAGKAATKAGRALAKKAAGK